MAISEQQQIARYDLLCRALQAQPDASATIFSSEQFLADLGRLIQHDLLALARQASPDDFAELYLAFEQELDRFREFVAYPDLATKTIVAFGGSFSAGKSSLINALLGRNLMVVEVDPTTALPAYVLAGEDDAVFALNQHQQLIALTDDEFASLTHDEKLLYGSQVARALTTAFVIRKDFTWPNLAFIDTPGYSAKNEGGGRTDAEIAKTQLNSAHLLIWIVSAKQGVIPESDLDFLAKIDPEIPRLIVVSRADQLDEGDLTAVVERVRTTLVERNLPVVGVYPASAHPRHKGLLEPIKEHLHAWNQTQRQQTFARRFKILFVRYQRGLEAERYAIQWRGNRLKRLQLLADAELLTPVDELVQESNEKKQALEAVTEQLTLLRKKLFSILKKVGDKVGIELPEPDAMELLEVGRSNLLELLVELRTAENQPALDLQQVLKQFCKQGPAHNQSGLLRRQPRLQQESWHLMQTNLAPSRQEILLRRLSLDTALQHLKSVEHASNVDCLLRKPVKQLDNSFSILC